jgi:hypothetical protein
VHQGSSGVPLASVLASGLVTGAEHVVQNFDLETMNKNLGNWHL